MSNDEIKKVTDLYYKWQDKTMKDRGISKRMWKIWLNRRRRMELEYNKSTPRIGVEEQIEKMKELINRVKAMRLSCDNIVVTFVITFVNAGLVVQKAIQRLYRESIKWGFQDEKELFLILWTNRARP